MYFEKIREIGDFNFMSNIFLYFSFQCQNVYSIDLKKSHY